MPCFLPLSLKVCQFLSGWVIGAGMRYACLHNIYMLLYTFYREEGYGIRVNIRCHRYETGSKKGRER